ncbi:MAG: dual specificity protein phosphatase family protein [Candidatus Omnitrophica bacterium]|nr:dual specificity protein phosphatase family protein [Candidatus Omnitrophota bacterium]MBU4333915.1 dual specificity protein phosphatase family protein [Candidatus Omnitrophota bacterium]
MIANNSYLIMAGIFLLVGIYSYQGSILITAVILFWSSIVFSFFWLLHFLKVNRSKDHASLFARDSFLKQCVFGVVFLPFYAFRYLALLLQSFSNEEPISQVTDKIFIGQQLLWFHKKVFISKKIEAVLDVTIENREPCFIASDKTIQYLRMPILDKTSPSKEQLENGASWGLEQVSQGRNLFVHCSAGHERSATLVAAILLKAGDCNTLSEVVEKIRGVRPKTRFVGNQQEILEKWFKG